MHRATEGQHRAQYGRKSLSTYTFISYREADPPKSGRRVHETIPSGKRATARCIIGGRSSNQMRGLCWSCILGRRSTAHFQPKPIVWDLLGLRLLHCLHLTACSGIIYKGATRYAAGTLPIRFRHAVVMLSVRSMYAADRLQFHTGTQTRPSLVDGSYNHSQRKESHRQIADLHRKIAQ